MYLLLFQNLPPTVNGHIILSRRTKFFSQETPRLLSRRTTSKTYPIIQSDIAGTRWNNDSPATLLFPKGDATVLCQQMKNIIDADYNQLYEKALDARQQAIRNLSVEAWAEKVIDYFNAI